MQKSIDHSPSAERNAGTRILCCVINPKCAPETAEKIRVDISALQHAYGHDIHILVHQSSLLDDIQKREQETREKIEELFFLGWGSIKQSSDKLVRVMTVSEWEESQKRWRMSDGIREQVQNIRPLLLQVGKIVWTDELKDEIDSWQGSGTLLYDEHRLEFAELNAAQEGVYAQVVRAYSGSAFKEREKNAVIRNYGLQIEKTLLGGCSYVVHGKEWVEIARLWAGQEGNGIGKKVLHFSVKQAREVFPSPCTLFALTAKDDVARRFEQCGFTRQNFTTDTSSRSGDYPEYVRNYAIPPEERRFLLTYTM